MFVVRMHRREGGGYTFSYGKGARKLEASCTQDGLGVWSIIGGCCFGTVPASRKLSEIREEWGRQAEASYGGKLSLKSCPEPTAIGPPRLSAVRRYDGPSCPDCGRPVAGWHDGLPPCRCAAPNPEDYMPDPFDPRMYGRVALADAEAGPVLTPLGALDVVYHWMLRNREYVTTDGGFDPVWEGVRSVLHRETSYPEYRPERPK